jgi:uncharacterized protein (TIGR02466 family)
MLQNIFFTPVFVHKFQGEILDNIQTEIEKQLPEIRKNQQASPWGDAVTTTFNFDATVNDIENYKLDMLKNMIFWSIKEYFKSLEYPFESIKISESWVNICNKHGFQFDHTHPRSKISGVYYYSTTGSDGGLRFQNPNPMMHYNGFPSDSNSVSAVTYKPSVGQLLLFPSWLTHRVNLNTTDSERISIAFNLE